ncbi:MAG: haloacid dehalogenase-like hydrolase [Bacteroidota bacterium]|nr:haloacid dehalogenase-like hydrolase [Bacteroidota bacterium]
MPEIAFFDFDGTITTKDTMLELIKFHQGRLRFYAGLALLSPWLSAMKLKLVSHQCAKEKMLSLFFKGFSEVEFSKICNSFIQNKLPSLINSEAIKRINEHKKNGDEIVVVSASASNWLKAWCDQNHLKCIATQLEIVNGKITGKLAGINCNYNEKANRIIKEYDLKNYSAVYCYGDTDGDKAMLKLATRAFYKKFT